MAQLSDDLRFQNLPPEDVREQIRQSMDKAGWKYILIEHTTWYNQKTRCKHDIYNMPIIAMGNTSNRPKAITEIYIETKPETGTYWEKQAHYTYNRDYVHVNICSRTSTDSGSLLLIDKDNENKRYKIYYESICNPITQSHFFSTPNLNDLKLIFTGQLMGQNGNSAFRTVDSVAGTYEDHCVSVINTTTFIKRSAPILQLLTRASIYDLQKKDFLIKKLQEVHFPKENEVACKLIGDNYYTIKTKEELKEFKEKKSVSAYYPIITHEMCNDIINNIPRMDIEFGCFGLGSAGTGVLDLLSRSTFFNNYLFVDFDTVEHKNLRNQWYNRINIGQHKTSASENIMKQRKAASIDIDRISIISFNKKFQNIPLQNFNFKYVFSAFDSIEARLEFVKTLHDNRIEAQYLIDTRYDDLTASIFFIDMKEQDQVDYYLNGLIEDKKAFDNMNKDKLIQTEEEFIDYLESKNVFKNNCSSTQRELYSQLNLPNEMGTYLYCPASSCGSDRCKEMFKKFFTEHIKDKHQLFKKEESSCVRQNFMDIYHFASTFVFDTIRQIEDNQPKLFTHIDVTTDPLPKSLLIRK